MDVELLRLGCRRLALELVHACVEFVQGFYNAVVVLLDALGAGTSVLEVVLPHHMKALLNVVALPDLSPLLSHQFVVVLLINCKDSFELF